MRICNLVWIVILLLGAVAPAVAQEGPDEDEPNDSRRDATLIRGLEISGEVGRGRDSDDWFELDGQEGRNPTIALEYDDRRCDIDLEVYSDDELVGSLTGTSGYETDEFDVPGECYIKVFSYDGEGEYSVTIEPGDDNRHNRRSDCEGQDEHEPNDDMRSATSIGDLTIDGYACNEEDWFVLEGQEGNYATITLTHESGCDIDLEIFSDDTSVGSLTGTSESDSGTFEIPGMCYIRVYPYDGEGAYTISIEPEGGERHHGRTADCEGPDEVEPNDTRDDADSINANEIIRGYACENEEDWFVIEGWGRHTSTLTFNYDHSEGDLEASFGSDADGNMYITVYATRGEGEYTIEIE